MKCNYITIEREYGSGGTKIARRLAEACNIACYGPEILEAVSKKNDVPVEHIQHYEESVPEGFLYFVCHEPGSVRRLRYADQGRIL